MRVFLFTVSVLIFFAGSLSTAFAECLTFRAEALSENLLEARFRAKVNRNLRAINVYGRRRMCGHARHTQQCNRYIRENVTCRIGTRNRFEPIHICVATGTVCSVGRRRRELFDGPQGFIGPFTPFLRKNKKHKRRYYKRRQYQK